jgi:hypothetical protein
MTSQESQCNNVRRSIMVQLPLGSHNCMRLRSDSFGRSLTTQGPLCRQADAMYWLNVCVILLTNRGKFAGSCNS